MTIPLSNFSVMRTSDYDECLDVVTRHIVPHDFRMKSGGGPFKAILNNVSLSGSSMTYLRYSTGINIGSAAGEDSYLIVVPLSGTVTSVYDRSQATLSDRRGIVIAPGRPFDLETQLHSSALIWKVSRKAIDRATNDMTGSYVNEPISFDPYLDWQCRDTARLWRSLNFVAQELDDLDSTEEGRRHQVQNLEQLLLRTLIAVQPNTSRRASTASHDGVAPRSVRRAEEFISVNSQLPLTITDIAAAAGVSERSLHRAFKEFRRISPISYLRDVRLRQIRDDLLNAGGDASVSDILTSRGVFQFGRFASVYKKQFGETPSETLRHH